MRKTSLTLTMCLGAQVQRSRVVRHGHTRFEAVQGGERFASLFPSLVGQELAIGRSGLELAGNPEMVRAVGWLSTNGYFLRGGLQR